MFKTISGLVLAAMLWGAAARGDLPPQAEQINAKFTIKSTADFARIAVTPDGKTMAVTVGPEDVAVYDVATGKAKATVKVDPVMTCLAISDDGRVIATGSPRNTLTVYTSVSPPRRFTVQNGMETVNGVSIRPDGRSIAFCDVRHNVSVWDVASQKVVFRGTPGPSGANQIKFSPDGSAIVTWGSSSTCYVLEPDGKTRVALSARKPGAPGSSIVCANFSPDSKMLATAETEGAVRVWDVKSGKLLQTLETGRRRDFNWAAFSPDGKTVATAMDDLTVALWDVESGQQKQTFSGHTGIIRRVEFSPDGKRLVSASSDRTMRLWRVPDGQAVGIMEEQDKTKRDIVWQVQFAGPKTVVSAGADRMVRIWDVAGEK